MFWIWCQKLGIFFSSIIQPQHTLWSSKSSNWNMYSELFLFQFVTRSVGRFWIFIVYSSNYCAHGSYEHHSIEDHFEKRQGYEKGIILKLLYWSNNNIRTYINYAVLILHEIVIFDFFFYQTKRWHGNVCWFLCFYLNWHDRNLKLFWTSNQNNFRFWSCKFS